MFKGTLPKLFNLLLRTNIICATSVPSESAFSVAGYIQRKERCRLKSKNLRFLMLTKQFDKLIELEKRI
jgi:hypothetical protein